MNRYSIDGGETFLYSYYPYHFLLPNQFGRKAGNLIWSFIFLPLKHNDGLSISVLKVVYTNEK